MWEYDYSTLCHGIKGHKYIRKERGNNGKWNYIYPDDLKRKENITNYSKIQSNVGRSIEEQKRSEEKQRKEENARKIHEERMKNDQGYRLSFAEKQRKYNKTQSDTGRSIEEQKRFEDYARRKLGSDVSKKIGADGLKEFVSISKELNDISTRLENLQVDIDLRLEEEEIPAAKIKEKYLKKKISRCDEKLKELGSKYNIGGANEINRLYKVAREMWMALL